MRLALQVCFATLLVAVCGLLGASNRPSGNSYLHFSGSGQYVEMPNAPHLSFGRDGLTVSAWLRTETLEFNATEGSGYVYWMGKGEWARQEWAMRMYSYTNRERPPRPNRISFYLFNLDGGPGEGSYFQQPVRPGEWIQVTAFAGDGTTTIYATNTMAPRPAGGRLMTNVSSPVAATRRCFWGLAISIASVASWPGAWGRMESCAPIGNRRTAGSQPAAG
jgi:hypothetical protein